MGRIKDAMSILVVSPDEADGLEIQRELEDSGISNPVLHVDEGLGALAMVQGAGTHPDTGGIGLILCAEELTDMHVTDLMQLVSERTGVRRLPFIVITQGEVPSDWKLLRQLGAAAWIWRPVTGHAVLRALQEAGSFWVELSVEPDLSSSNWPQRWRSRGAWDPWN